MDHLDRLILFGLILNLSTGSPWSEGVTRKTGHDQQMILGPHSKIFTPASNDPQTVRDALEAGHEEPETSDEARATMIPLLRTRLWQGSLWFLLRSLCVSVVGNVSATARTPPTPPPPHLHSVRRDCPLINSSHFSRYNSSVVTTRRLFQP